MLSRLRLLSTVPFLSLGLIVAAIGCASESQHEQAPYDDAHHDGGAHHEHHGHHDPHADDPDEHHHEHDTDPYADVPEADPYAHPEDDPHAHDAGPQPQEHGEIDGGFESAEEAVDAAYNAILELDAVALSNALLPEHRPMAEDIIAANEQLVEQIGAVDVTVIDHPEESVAATEVEYLDPDGTRLGSEAAYSVEIEGRWFFVILDPEPADDAPQPHDEQDPFGE